MSKLQHKFSDFFYNRLTYSGIFLAIIIFLIELLLFGIDFFSDHHSVYLGIITYMILPPFLILGLCLIPIGALWRRHRVLKGTTEHGRTPIYVNFNNPKHRNAFIIFVTGTIVLIVMSVIGSYQAYEYTESVHFCGITCHDIMQPEYTRYLQSPHARVKCVDCHVGGGVDSYLNAKMNGVKQIISMAKGSYPRPITGPLENLRPANEICERCHWPGKSFGVLERSKQYFFTEDDAPQRWFVRMLLKVGDKERNGNGIHSHMYLDRDIYYVAADKKRQQIPWVKSVDKQGNVKIFNSPDSPYINQDPPAERVKKMDCIDCHNRPTHKFLSPSVLLNEAIAVGAVDADLPAVKKKAMELLSGTYISHAQAEQAIRDAFIRYYRETLGSTYEHKRESVERSAAHIVHLYKNNFFPKMLARWDQHPDNIGHLISPGCYRCHGGEHTSKDGRVIPRDCTTCHTIVEQGIPGETEKNPDGLPFRHPVDIAGVWEDMNCFECHTGN